MINFGNEEQKRRFLPDMLKGNIRFCLGVTEPDGKISQLSEWTPTKKIHSWVRCRRNNHYCREKRRCLYCQWSQEMDHQWDLRRLLHCRRENRRRRNPRHLRSDHPTQGSRCNMQKDRKLRRPREWVNLYRV